MNVSLDATVGDVITALINVGFLDTDSQNHIYNVTEEELNVELIYDDRSKTIKEYGWQNGKIILSYLN